MGEETVAELRVPDVDDAVKRVRALDAAGDDGEREQEYRSRPA